MLHHNHRAAPSSKPTGARRRMRRARVRVGAGGPSPPFQTQRASCDDALGTCRSRGCTRCARGHHLAERPMERSVASSSSFSVIFFLLLFAVGQQPRGACSARGARQRRVCGKVHVCRGGGAPPAPAAARAAGAHGAECAESGESASCLVAPWCRRLLRRRCRRRREPRRAGTSYARGESRASGPPTQA